MIKYLTPYVLWHSDPNIKVTCYLTEQMVLVKVNKINSVESDCRKLFFW